MKPRSAYKTAAYVGDSRNDGATEEGRVYHAALESTPK